ncbi:Aladin-related family protein, partial [Quillaja saponaria]
HDCCLIPQYGFIPRLGSVTICEINRDLITAESLSDDRAKETYGKLLGMVFSPVPFQSQQLVPPTSENEAEQEGRTTDESSQSKNLVAVLQVVVKDSLRRFFYPIDVSLLPEVDLQGVSWHQHKHIIAFISGTDQVIVHDYEDSEGKDSCTLTNESQEMLEYSSGGQMVVECFLLHARVEYAYGLLLIREMQRL